MRNLRLMLSALPTSCEALFTMGNQQIEITSASVAEIAQKYLDEQHPGGATLMVVPDAITHEESWWYIGVKTDREPGRLFEYFEALADAEVKIEEQENLTVFFRPVAADGTTAR
jgi:hypothetical protein